MNSLINDKVLQKKFQEYMDLTCEIDKESRTQTLEKVKENGEYTLIWADLNEDGSYDLMNPKNLMGMTLEKAKGSLEWTKKCLGKGYKCFIYDPSKISLFNEDGSQNVEVIKELIFSLEWENNSQVTDNQNRMLQSSANESQKIDTRKGCGDIFYPQINTSNGIRKVKRKCGNISLCPTCQAEKSFNEKVERFKKEVNIDNIFLKIDEIFGDGK
jgi:hypothetical protein